MSWKSFFTKEKKEDLDQGLEKTKQSFFAKIANTVAGKSKVDEDLLDDLEEVLISSDVSVKTTLKIIDRLEQRVKLEKYIGVNQLTEILKSEIAQMLRENNVSDISDYSISDSDSPHVVMVVV
jgi:fused signal recognition particle receptor